MKKIFNVLFILLTIILCAFCFSSCTNNEFRFGDYRYTVENDEVTITKYIGNDAEVSIPESINGMPVTAIGTSAFLNRDKMRSVTVPDSVVRLGSLAFAKCYALEQVTLGRGVREIDFSPFSFCEKINYNKYENGCYVGNSENPYLALVSMEFEDVEAVSIHADTVVICGSAMENCGSIRELVIPNSVVSIGSFAFRYCSLEKVYIPESVMSIGLLAFGDSISNFVVSDENPNFKSVDGSLFSRDGKRLIKYATGQDISFYSIPDGTVIVEESAFENAMHLNEVVVADSVEEIGHFAFLHCENLRDVQLGNSLKTIEGGAFGSCYSLTEITIPDSVENISYSVFSYCKNLKSAVIGSGVISMHTDVFMGCDALGSVTFRDPDGWEVITAYSFISKKMDVSDPTKNAEYLTGEYSRYYWNKK